VRLNDPLTGHFSGYFPIPLSEVEAIEVIKGAGSGIYGTEAVGAVIQVFSKGYKARQDSSIHGKLSLQAGSYNSLLGDGYIQMDRKLWSIGLGASRRSSEGHTPPNDSIPYDFELSTYSLNAQFHLGSGWRAGIRAALDDRDFSARYFYTTSSIDLSRETVERVMAQAYLHKEFNHDLILHFHGGWMSTDDAFIFNPAFPGNFHTTVQSDAHADLMWQAKEKISYTFGAQWIGRDVSSNDRGDHRFDQFGLYALQQWNLGNWKWQLSGRLEHHDAFGWEFVPQTSLSTTINDVRIRTFAGRSIRAADVTELYVSNNLESLSPGRNLGNPELGAESAWNAELGISGELSEIMEYSVTGFYRLSTDLIDFALTPATLIPNASNIDAEGDYFFARNVGELETAGIDIQLSAHHEINEEHEIRYGLGLLWTDHLDSISSRYIAGSEGIILNGNFQYHFKRLDLGVIFLYKERDSQSAIPIARNLNAAYALADLSLGFRVYDQLKVNLNCRNLLDRQYADVLGAQMPGRWWLGGLSYSF
jgi:iron complex outermembrane receptor protein